MSQSGDFSQRQARDALGTLLLPAAAHYGIATQRALDNFAISGQRLPEAFLRAHLKLKGAAAQVNAQLGRLPQPQAQAICEAVDALLADFPGNEFPLDIYQTGSATSTNMNVNEVLASLANVRLGGKPGDISPIHPNDQVNLGQSSNDTIPTSLHLAAIDGLDRRLLPALDRLIQSLRGLSEQTWDVLKTGRTHLQDATPLRMGQEFQGFQGLIELAREHLQAAREQLLPVPLGGTAVGTGINTHPDFARLVCQELHRRWGIPLVETRGHFQALLEAAGFLSAQLRGLALALTKIANDLRWMASGPLAGLAEIQLPALQPGSSIMPAKINPVLLESLLMVCYRVQGNDAAVVAASSAAQFQLQTAMPLLIASLLESIDLLSAAVERLVDRVLSGLKATPQGPALVERSPMLATALVPFLGYDATAMLVKQAQAQRRSILEVALETSGLSESQLRWLLDPHRQLTPQA